MNFDTSLLPFLLCNCQMLQKRFSTYMLQSRIFYFQYETSIVLPFKFVRIVNPLITYRLKYRNIISCLSLQREKRLSIRVYSLLFVQRLSSSKTGYNFPHYQSFCYFMLSNALRQSAEVYFNLEVRRYFLNNQIHVFEVNTNCVPK